MFCLDFDFQMRNSAIVDKPDIISSLHPFVRLFSHFRSVLFNNKGIIRICMSFIYLVSNPSFPMVKTEHLVYLFIRR